MTAETQRADDSAFIAGIRAKGRSRDAIFQTLRERGLSREEAEEAVDGDGTYAVQVRPPESAAVAGDGAEAGPEGIAGWLVLAAVWLPLQVLIGLLGISQAVKAWGERNAGDVIAQRVMTVQAAGEVLGLAFTVVCLVLFFRKNRGAPGAIVALNLYAVALMLILIGLAGRDTSPLAYTPSLAQGMPISVFGVVYFLTSVRVKNTFVR